MSNLNIIDSIRSNTTPRGGGHVVVSTKKLIDEYFEIARELNHATEAADDEMLFQFPSLEQIRENMKAAGYSDEEIEDDIAGLSELPEYGNSNRNPTSEE